MNNWHYSPVPVSSSRSLRGNSQEEKAWNMFEDIQKDVTSLEKKMSRELNKITSLKDDANMLSSGSDKFTAIQKIMGRIPIIRRFFKQLSMAELIQYEYELLVKYSGDLEDYVDRADVESADLLNQRDAIATRISELERTIEQRGNDANSGKKVIRDSDIDAEILPGSEKELYMDKKKLVELKNTQEGYNLLLRAYGILIPKLRDWDITLTGYLGDLYNLLKAQTLVLDGIEIVNKICNGAQTLKEHANATLEISSKYLNALVKVRPHLLEDGLYTEKTLGVVRQQLDEAERTYNTSIRKYDSSIKQLQ